MARKLARNTSESGDDSKVNANDDRSKGSINRRQYVKLGGTAVMAMLIGGASSGVSTGSASEQTQYWTDFSSGAL